MLCLFVVFILFIYIYFLQLVTISLVVPTVLHLYQHVKWFEADHLATIAADLRDGLIKRFTGILTQCKVIRSVDSNSKPFENEIYLISTLLDPSYGLLWVREELDLESSQLELEKEIKGKWLVIQSATAFLSPFLTMQELSNLDLFIVMCNKRLLHILNKAMEFIRWQVVFTL